MDSIILENFRCFGARQVARLAPLTLLVGENSTGKTSFLALIRVLWDVAIANAVPNFSAPPYDLGSFRDIAHGRGARGSRELLFTGGFTDGDISHCVTFDERNSVPFPYKRKLSANNSWVEIVEPLHGEASITVGTPDKRWVYATETGLRDNTALIPIGSVLNDIIWESEWTGRPSTRIKLIEGRQPDQGDLKKIREIRTRPRLAYRKSSRPFAGAPVRSRPLRAYSVTGSAVDTEGEYIPSYLAGLSAHDKPAWERLKESIEEFGSRSGLFNEIRIRRFEERLFQVQVRKHDKGLKGPWRNIVDVGYGISQALPIIVDLLREDMPPISLLQQPEVHLHPTAQAALGSLFSSIAGERIASNARGVSRRSKRQFIVETHSDYIIDRVRMDVRDKKTSLKPEDVSILFFERTGLDVTIHSLRIDEQGNVLNAPPGYRQFFLDELDRSIGF